jgi:hypothetical protein
MEPHSDLGTAAAAAALSYILIHLHAWYMGQLHNAMRRIGGFLRCPASTAAVAIPLGSLDPDFQILNP